MKLDAIDLKEKLRIDSHDDEDQTTHLDIAECSLHFLFSSHQVFALPMNTHTQHIHRLLNPRDENDEEKKPSCNVEISKLKPSG